MKEQKSQLRLEQCLQNWLIGSSIREYGNSARIWCVNNGLNEDNFIRVSAIPIQKWINVSDETKTDTMEGMRNADMVSVFLYVAAGKSM